MANKESIIDIENATHQELLDEYESCENLWSKYSCDSLGYYMQALHDAIVNKGGWPVRTNTQNKSK